MHLKAWSEQNTVSDNMTWKGGVAPMFKDFADFAEIVGGEPMVISTHRSKSISLPVVQVTTPYGVRITMRDNFHDIKVSIESPKPVTENLFGLAAGADSYLRPVYFEGFPSEFIFEPFVPGATKFSLCCGARSLLSVARAVRYQFDGRNPYVIKDDEIIQDLITWKKTAEAEGFPVLFRPGTVSVTYRFFETQADIPPNEDKLREAFTKQAPGYDGKIDPKPIPYLELDFSGGCPKPVDEWLMMLNQLVYECRNDPNVSRLGGDRGARVNVLRLTQDLKERAKALKLAELLVPPNHR